MAHQWSGPYIVSEANDLTYRLMTMKGERVKYPVHVFHLKPIFRQWTDPDVPRLPDLRAELGPNDPNEEAEDIPSAWRAERALRAQPVADGSWRVKGFG